MPTRKRTGKKNPPQIEVIVRSARWRKRPTAKTIVKKAVLAAAKAVSTRPTELAIVLSDDSAIRTLNRDWRGKNAPTNVLSFPAPKTDGGPTKFIGDIVIAYETLARECDDEDRVFLHHLAHLTVHGFLHLIGYDHQSDSDADEMEGLESKIMNVLNMPDPYPARDLGNA